MDASGRIVLVVCGFLLVLSFAGCASVEEQAAFDEFERVSSTLGYGREPRDLPQLGKGSAVGDYLAYAALNNPRLEAAFNRWKAALERVPQARSLPDPRFTYQYFIEQVETRVGPQRHSIGLAQMFPWFGKLGLRAGSALEAAGAERQRYEIAKLGLFYRVQNAYYEYAYLARAIAIVGENRALVKYLERVTRARYKAATARHQDVIRAQVELGRLDDRLRALVDLRGPMMARVNAALNRPIDAEIPWPARLPYEQVSVTAGQILASLRKASPELKALGHEIARRRHAVELAKKNYFPDVTLGVTYIDTGAARMGGVPDSGKDPVVAMVSINLPIWRQKYRAAEREAQARLRAAILERTGKENRLSSDARMALYKFQDADRKIDLYRDTLVPRAKQALKATETAFSTGRASFLDLIDAQRILLEFQLSYERALTNRAQRLAEIETLTGKKIPRSKVKGSNK